MGGFFFYALIGKGTTEDVGIWWSLSSSFYKQIVQLQDRCSFLCVFVLSSKGRDRSDDIAKEKVRIDQTMGRALLGVRIERI